MSTNNTDGAALLPVTQADRDAAADYIASFKTDPTAPSKTVQNTRDGKANSALVQAFARHRISHSLPGEVGTLRAALAPFAAVCDAFDYWVPEVMPDFRYPVAGTELANAMIDCPTAIGALTESAFRAARAALTPSALSGDAGEGASYLIWSNEHCAWWAPNRCGYTREAERAGRYDRSEAMRIAGTGRGGWMLEKNPSEIAIPEADALEQALHPNRLEAWANDRAAHQGAE